LLGLGSVSLVQYGGFDMLNFNVKHSYMGGTVGWY